MPPAWGCAIRAPPLQTLSENADEGGVTALHRHRTALGFGAPVAFAVVASLSGLSASVHAFGSPAPVALPQQAAGQGQRDDALPRRLIGRFDFEESEEFAREIPVGFYRALTAIEDDLAARSDREAQTQGSTGVRAFGRIESVRGAGRPGGRGVGNWAVRFTVDGSSMRLASEPSRIEVAAGAQLLVRAFGRSEGLQQAAMRLSARFHDKEGIALPGVYSSAMLRSEGNWRLLAVEPPPTPVGATGLSLWLEVIQPSVFRDRDDAYALAVDDVSGTAFFDDIEVWQVPTVVFEAEASGVVPSGSRAVLQLRCSDPSIPRTSATVVVRDAEEALVHQSTLEVPGDGSVRLEIPQLATGWYEASVSYMQGGTEVSQRRARFTVLPADGLASDDAPRFGTSFSICDERVLPAIDLSRSAFAILPFWTAATDTRDPQKDLERFRLLLLKLLDRQVGTVGRIAQVPSYLARQNRVDIDDSLALFALEEERWRPSLEPWLLGFGQQIDHWIIGTPPVDGNRGDLAARVGSLAKAMRAAIAGPSVGLPWSPSEVLPEDLASTIVDGRHVLEVVIDPYWRESGGEAFEGLPKGKRGIARIVPIAPGTVDDRSRAVDLAVRALDAWRYGFDAIAVDVRNEGVQTIPGPPIELAAWRQLSVRLSGRRFVAEIPLHPDLRAWLADGPRGPALVVWSDAASGVVECTTDLGGAMLTATDLWGRSTRVPATPKGHALRIGREPVFIEGLDPYLALLRRGLRIDPPVSISRRAPQDGSLFLENPWPTSIAGTLTILGPESLGITPRTHAFSIDAGGEARMPITYSVPRSMQSGPTMVSVLIQGTATEQFRLELEAPLVLGYKAIKVEPSWRLARSIESGTLDLVLTLRVTNVGDRTLDVEAFAVADGYTQSRKPVSSLDPGGTAVRVFHFADGVRRLSGRDIRTGVHDTVLDARYLTRVPIPPLLPPAAALRTARAQDDVSIAGAAGERSADKVLEEW